jgi:hypothetical protein
MAAEFVGGGRRRFIQCHQDGVYASGRRRVRME